MRSLFQEQPEVAHVYLGSKRAMMERLFNDANEPFWRSAKQVELGVIPPRLFADFIRDRFDATGRAIDETVIDAILERTHAHPYGTQELATTPSGRSPIRARQRPPRSSTKHSGRVLRSETAPLPAYLGRRPEGATPDPRSAGQDPGQPPLSIAYRREHNLPGTSTIQRALEALSEDELIQRHQAGYRIAEPFLAEWILQNDV